MINLAPINKNVRQTLVDREKAAARRDSQNSHETISEKLQHKLVKALWVKMYSGVNWNGINGARIYGGEVFKNVNEGYPLNFGFTELYEDSHPLAPTTDRLKRPIAGILDLSCEYKGGLKAIREATINWVAHSLTDLERLIPFFASPGKGILLEWGYGSTKEMTSQTNTTVDEKDFLDGTAYTGINSLVLKTGGLYDGMAGIISNFEWSLRDDGGFNVQTTIVSRGVNVLSKQLDQADAPLTTSNTGQPDTQEVWPTLGEFIAGMQETLITIAVGSTSWFGSKNVSKPLAKPTDTTWQRGSVQPPGVFMTRSDGSWFGLTKNAGPYMTWGWMEDNILSKWVAKYDEKGNITNSFRSIEPVVDKETGQFESQGGGLTDDIKEAKFQSVVVSNHFALVTPHRDRWIIPGQFPVEEDEETGFFDKLRLNPKEFSAAVSSIADNNFEKFGVSNNENDGGYLRNLILSVDMVMEAFQDAKTLSQGLQNLFNDINSDVNGFWSFTVVNDPYLAGNVKVIDTKSTVDNPSSYIEKAKNTKEENKVDSPMYVFESWGDRSIVISQTLSAKLPSSFAVSAMYAGTAKKGTSNTQGDADGAAFGSLGGDGDDESQKNIVEPAKLSGKFGSINPFLLENAGDMSGTSDGYFGVEKGIEFDLIDWKALIEKYQENHEDRKDDEKDAADKKIDSKANTASKTDAPITNFFKDFDSKALYTDDGNLKENFKDEILHKRVMNNILSGTVNKEMKSISADKAQKMKDAQTSTDLYPVDLDITISGIGGIYPGNVFHVSYLPDRFKNYCVFQVMSVSQAISGGKWETSIGGQLRVAIGAIMDAAGYDPQLITKGDAKIAEDSNLGQSETTNSRPATVSPSAESGVNNPDDIEVDDGLVGEGDPDYVGPPSAPNAGDFVPSGGWPGQG